MLFCNVMAVCEISFAINKPTVDESLILRRSCSDHLSDMLDRLAPHLTLASSLVRTAHQSPCPSIFTPISLAAMSPKAASSSSKPPVFQQNTFQTSIIAPRSGLPSSACSPRFTGARDESQCDEELARSFATDNESTDGVLWCREAAQNDEVVSQTSNRRFSTTARVNGSIRSSIHRACERPPLLQMEYDEGRPHRRSSFGQRILVWARRSIDFMRGKAPRPN
jgi:hypothetical protein